ncbi:MAG: di-heme oxidoredictase family protein [Pseudomonadota bacterium]|nr:thiol oxidoreductase [Gammaproteobacteria bacterium]MEC8009762.1 di-heme oxidoredictase family protein [Pseudomonadota bacterium]|tara:strand:+ start:1647 stop:4952 length:3306 start_codon:yes stop_codon:yes gene_type:complete
MPIFVKRHFAPLVLSAMGLSTAGYAIETSELSPVQAVASSSEANHVNAEKAIDLNINTRWSSQFTDDEWLYLDFGQAAHFDSVTLNWENAHAKNYELQVSNDAENWTTIQTITDSQGGQEELTLNTEGRYLRMKGINRSTGYGYSIFEIKTFGYLLESNDSTDTIASERLIPVSALASDQENNNTGAFRAMDGSMSSRWASAFNDDQWIYFDFGNNVHFSNLDIHWEGAYAKEYAIQVSDNSIDWTTAKTITNSDGGFDGVPLSADGRFLRIKGIKRATGYGYSIFEIEAMGSGQEVADSNTPVDNTDENGEVVDRTAPEYTGEGTAPSYNQDYLNLTEMTIPEPFPTASTEAAPVASPVGPEGYTPLFADNTPLLEHVQYTEADGTLVTVAGFRPVDRHARESGEPWFNSQADNAANNWNQVDEGPGRHLTFPTFYFQNRTMSLVIRDEVPAGRSRVSVYLQVNNGKMLDVGMSAFHSMNPMLEGFGWAALGGFLNLMDTPIPSTRETTARYCSSDDGPFDCISDMIYLAPFANDRCDPTWQDCYAEPVNPYVYSTDPTVPNENRTFNIGDLIEITPAFFLEKGADGTAAIDGGGTRYYSQEKLYVVGKGIIPWYGVYPRLNNAPLPAESLSGGTASTSYNYSEEPFRSFQQAVENIGGENMQRFVEGRRLFHTSFKDGKHSESPNINPVFSEHADKIGDRFNGERCFSCHQMNGRSLPAEVGETIETMSIMTALESTGDSFEADPTYGMNVQQLSLNSSADDYSVTVSGFETVKEVTLSGNKTVELTKPVYDFANATPTVYSVRQAPQVIGMGLIEALDEETILAQADPNDADGDGIRGIPNWSIDPETGLKHLGRYGWKAGKGSIRHQAAQALMLDIGVTSPLYKSDECQADATSAACKNAALADGSVNNEDLETLSHYLELLGVPAQRNVETVWEGNRRVPFEHEMDTAAIARGEALFSQMNCASCHTPSMTTGENHPMQELRNQDIRPYSDFLLHDMGPALADGIVENEAEGSMWRTQPLWGLGLLAYTQETAEEMAGPNIKHGELTRARYLHDGRAKTITEAILWHGGEAEASRTQFEGLTESDREDLLAFLRSL